MMTKMKKTDKTSTAKKTAAKKSTTKKASSKKVEVAEEVYAAIAMALYQEGYDVHDENPRFTLKRTPSVSAWGLKSHLMLKEPQRY